MASQRAAVTLPAIIIGIWLLKLTSSTENQNLYLTVIGGWSDASSSHPNTIYDFNTGASYAASPSKQARLHSYGSVEVNNTIYIVGGYNGPTLMAYNLLSDSWTYLPSVPLDFWFHVQVVLYGDSLITWGGFRRRKTLFRYNNRNIVDGQWNEMNGALPRALRSSTGHVVTIGSRTYLYVIGGGDTKEDNSLIEHSNKIYRTLLDTNALSWTSVATMNFAREEHQSIAVDGSIYIIGGTSDTPPPFHVGNTVEVYNTVKELSTTTNKKKMSFLRRNFGAALIPNTRRIFVCGGIYSNADSETYDIDRDHWSIVALRIKPTFWFNIAFTTNTPWVVSNAPNNSLCAFPDANFHSPTTNVTKCYRAFTSTKLDWPHAKVACKLWGGHLVTITSADENDWVASTLLPNGGENDRAWIGMHSHETFFWNGAVSASQSGKIIDTVQGGALIKKSSSYPLHCGYIAVTGNWYTRECWSNYSFVCEKPFKGVPESTLITTTTPPTLTTTCSPFGAVASCNITLLGQYGTVQQDRAACLILGGIDQDIPPLTWTAANAKCKSILDGNLVEIEDIVRWRAVTNLAAIAQVRTLASGAWTGLQNYYRWTDGHELTYIPSQSSLKNSYGLCYAFANATGDYSTSFCSDTSIQMPYICQVAGCPAGMTTVPDCNDDNYVCTEENECFSGKADCGGAAATCVDLLHDKGRYQCNCQPGFKQSNPNDPQSICVDISECADPNICNTQVQGGVCIEQYGGYLCACKNGHRLSGNTSAATQIGQKCVEVNECLENPNICGPGKCVNIPGSYTCSCNAGYQSVNGKCIDINECALMLYPCGINTAQAFCNNQAGYDSVNWPKGFTCTCPAGYTFMLNSSTCVQMNNCQPGGTSVCGSDPKAQCVNYQQQYYCACSGGYNYNWFTAACEAIDLAPLTYGNGTLLVVPTYSP